MTLGIYIAHAAFLPERKATLDRLFDQLGHTCTICRSEQPEHASTWAARLYQRALDDAPDFACFLNDDVIVPPNFRVILEAMHSARPHDVLSLHTTFPMARMLTEAMQRWFRAFWLTGPGYSMPLARLRSLVKYRERLPRWFVQSRNEDNVAMQWMWHEQWPAWHPLPAVVRHDVTVPSSLGYDKHPLREPTLTWEDVPAGWLTDWRQDGTPILFECPWMPGQQLALHAGEVGVR